MEMLTKNHTPSEFWLSKNEKSNNSPHTLNLDWCKMETPIESHRPHKQHWYLTPHVHIHFDLLWNFTKFQGDSCFLKKIAF